MTTSPQVVNVKTNMETGKYIAIKAPKIVFYDEYIISPIHAFTITSSIYIVYKIDKIKDKKMTVIIDYLISTHIIKANMLFPTHNFEGKSGDIFFNNFGSILDLVLSIYFIKEVYNIPSFRPILLEQFKYDNDNVFSDNKSNDETIQDIIMSLMRLKNIIDQKIIDKNITVTYLYVLIDFDIQRTTDNNRSLEGSIKKMYKKFNTDFINKFKPDENTIIFELERDYKHLFDRDPPMRMEIDHAENPPMRNPKNPPMRMQIDNPKNPPVQKYQIKPADPNKHMKPGKNTSPVSKGITKPTPIRKVKVLVDSP